jgi:1,4-dihydroxy-2-naphthoyl-CoA synthase
MNIRIEHRNNISIVTIDRPEVRNAVDRATAQALAEAFRAFDVDDSQAVAILTGAGGTFCAGADLKAIAEGRGNRIEISGDGPMGPTRMTLSKPVIAAIEAMRSPAVWNWHCGATCAWPPTMRCSACSAGAGACRWSTAARSGCPG